MAAEPVILINLLKVEPDKQAALITLLKRNIKDVLGHSIDEIEDRISGIRDFLFAPYVIEAVDWARLK